MSNAEFTPQGQDELIKMWKNPKLRPLCLAAIQMVEVSRNKRKFEIVVSNLKDMAIVAMILSNVQEFFLLGQKLLQLLETGVIRHDETPTAN
jgi:hypothetical protein